MLCRRGTGGERDGAGDGRGIGAREEGQKVGELTLSSHAWTATARRGGIRRNRRGERRGRGGKVEDAAVDFRRPRLDSVGEKGEGDAAKVREAPTRSGEAPKGGNFDGDGVFSTVAACGSSVALDPKFTGGKEGGG